MIRAAAVLGTTMVAMVLAGCGKPCEPIPGGESVKKLGLVLDGGRLCKDESSVATIDYPGTKAAPLIEKYKSKFSDWKAEAPDDKTLLLTRGDKDTLFIIAADKSKDRGVPFAIIRYCEAAYCRTQLTELATALAKYKH